MKAVIILELDTPTPDDLDDAVRFVTEAQIPFTSKVVRVAVGEIAGQVLESINPPKGH